MKGLIPEIIVTQTSWGELRGLSPFSCHIQLEKSSELSRPLQERIEDVVDRVRQSILENPNRNQIVDVRFRDSKPDLASQLKESLSTLQKTMEAIRLGTKSLHLQNEPPNLSIRNALLENIEGVLSTLEVLHLFVKEPTP
jgi:hypothetical protein